MRVGIDLDGVCYDFAGSFRNFLVRYRGYTAGRCPDATRWEFYEDWGLNLPQFLAEFALGVDAGFIFTHGDPYEGTKAAFDKMSASGHTLHIVTDRSIGEPGNAQAATIRWLARHGLKYDSIAFTADKTVARVDVMVDDKLSNYQALKEAGCEAWLLNRPWNQTLNPAAESRVTSLTEFADMLTARSAASPPRAARKARSRNGTT